ncbi:MAG: FxSxx-COOH system tetratricopeptide repeat protein, partial [bacterium]
MRDFFISYNQADEDWAKWIDAVLVEAGFTTFIQAWDCRPGDNFVLFMQQAAAKSQRTIAVLSQNYLNALYTQPEWTAAFVQDPTGAQGKLLPVQVSVCQLEGLWRPIVHIKLVGLNEAQARTALLDGIKREQVRPLVPPPFPGKPLLTAPQRPLFPGLVQNIPAEQNRNFTGRQKHLNRLHKLLAAGKSTALVALHGTGGVGKTQIALQYSYQHAADYQVIWWVSAEEAFQLSADFGELAVRLKLISAEAKQEDKVSATRSWLEENSGWLLVLDNLPQPADLPDCCPASHTGRLLITSRYEGDWCATAEPLDVDVFTPQEAVKFLHRRTEKNESTAAEQLAVKLGNLPLALEHAAAYVNETACTLANYLALYERHHLKLLRQAQPPPGYKATIATTWEISFQRAQERSPQAAKLLPLCAFLAPEAIPRELLQRAVKDDLACHKAIAVLRSFSLLQARGEGFFMHRLLQEVVRERLTEAKQKRWAETAVRLLNESFTGHPQTDVQRWATYAELLPHALAAAEHAEKLQIALPAIGRILTYSGLFLHCVRADYAAALPLCQRALGIDEKALGKNHPEVATDLNNLAGLYYDQGDTAD